MACSRLGRHVEAIKYFRMRSKFQGHSPEVLLNLGKAYDFAGQREQAKNAYTSLWNCQRTKKFDSVSSDLSNRIGERDRFNLMRNLWRSILERRGELRSR